MQWGYLRKICQKEQLGFAQLLGFRLNMWNVCKNESDLVAEASSRLSYQNQHKETILDKEPVLTHIVL